MHYSSLMIYWSEVTLTQAPSGTWEDITWCNYLYWVSFPSLHITTSSRYEGLLYVLHSVHLLLYIASLHILFPCIIIFFRIIWNVIYVALYEKNNNIQHSLSLFYQSKGVLVRVWTNSTTSSASSPPLHSIPQTQLRVSGCVEGDLHSTGTE